MYNQPGYNGLLDFANIKGDYKAKQQLIDNHIYHTLGGTPVHWQVVYYTTLNIDQGDLAELLERTGYSIELENAEVMVK